MSSSSSGDEEFDSSQEQESKPPPASRKAANMTAEPRPSTKASQSDSDDEPITDPGLHDVLMGRGAPSTDAPGNLKFRDLVKLRRQEYVTAKRRKEKQHIAGEIIATVKSRGGRFLERVETFRKTTESGETKKITIWTPVDDRKTLLVKVKQLMRDVGPDAQEKRNQRREQRRQKDVEELLEKKTRSSFQRDSKEESVPKQVPVTKALESLSPPMAPSAGLPIRQVAAASFLQPSSALQMAAAAGLQHSSFTGAEVSLPLHSSASFSAGDPLIRLRLEQEAAAAFQQEAALRQEVLLRQRLSQHQPQASSSSSAAAFGGMGQLHQTSLFGSQRDAAFLQQQLRMAQEEALMQQHLQQQQRSQAMGHHHAFLMGSPTSQQGLGGQSQQHQQQGHHQGSLLAAIMRRNAAHAPGWFEPDSKQEP